MGLAFFDIDGTLTRAHVWGGLMAYFKVHGRKRFAHLLYISIHYPLYFMRKRGLMGEQTFRYRWSADLGWYLRGETEDSAAEIGRWVAEEYLADTWHEDVIARLKAHLERGDTVLLVSAAPQPLVEGIARHLGVAHSVGTRFEVRNGRYTGKVIPPPALGKQKFVLARDYLAFHGLPTDFADAWAYADSITDLGILEEVGHPVAVYPDDALRSLAAERGWEILPPENPAR